MNDLSVTHTSYSVILHCLGDKSKQLFVYLVVKGKGEQLGTRAIACEWQITYQYKYRPVRRYNRNPGDSNKSSGKSNIRVSIYVLVDLN